MSDAIAECTEKIGPTPRKFSAWDRMSYFRVRRPVWVRLNPGEKLRALFENMEEVFRGGRVVWGHVIQANQLMFDEGRMNCPGELVYSLEDTDAADPGHLSQVARELFSLKETKPAECRQMYRVGSATRPGSMVLP